MPATFFFPDTAEGNAAMCRNMAWGKTREADGATQEQSARQTQTVISHFFSGPGDDFVYDSLGNITAPTLVLVGSQDIILPVGDSQVLAERIPDANLIEFPGAGHAAAAQNEGEFASYISGFLDLD